MYLFLAFMLLLAACHESVHSAHLDFDRLCNLTHPQFREKLLKDVMNRLQQKYDIENGLVSFWTCDPKDPTKGQECSNYHNPSTAYGSTLVPCPDANCPPETPASSSSSGKSAFYQPKQDHALVLFGCLPPETDYFGIVTYLYEKSKSNVEDDLDCKGVLGSPTAGDDLQVFAPPPTVPETRVVVDSPWYDTRNQLSINAVGKPDSQTNFGSLFVHVTTANKEVSKDIVKAFVDSGVPVEAMNIDSIPNVPVFHLEGNSSVRDSLRTVYRLALPDSWVSSSDDSPSSSTDEMNEYMALENKNILVGYLKPKDPKRSNGFLPQRPTDRTVEQKETDIVGGEAFQQLLALVKSHYGEPNDVSNPIPSDFKMRRSLQGCYGGGTNLDTVYINANRISLAGGDFAVVCGANHLLLGYAVYTNIGIFNISGLAVGVVTDEMKPNSTLRFAPHVPDFRNFYCVEIRSECHDDPFCAQPIFDDIKTVMVLIRINLNPQTKTGPSQNELIWPVILSYPGNSNNIPSHDLSD